MPYCVKGYKGKFLSNRDEIGRMERKTDCESIKIRIVIENHPLTKCRKTDCLQ